MRKETRGLHACVVRAAYSLLTTTAQRTKDMEIGDMAQMTDGINLRERARIWAAMKEPVSDTDRDWQMEKMV